MERKIYMTEKNIKKLRLIRGVVLSCLILVTGACLIWACLSIYGSGEKPFSRESVGLWFSKIRIPVYLCLACILGGGILDWCFPLPQAKEKGVLDGKTAVARLLSRFPESEFDPTAQACLQKERKLRRILTIACTAACLIAAVLCLIYACNPANYTLENLNGDILRSALTVLGCSAAAIVLCYVCKRACDASISRELAVIKDAVKSVSPVKKEQTDGITKSNLMKKQLIRCAILLVGILFVLLGIFNGGVEDVLGKAIRICTECIGLG